MRVEIVGYDGSFSGGSLSFCNVHYNTLPTAMENNPGKKDKAYFSTGSRAVVRPVARAVLSKVDLSKLLEMGSCEISTDVRQFGPNQQTEIVDIRYLD